MSRSSPAQPSGRAKKNEEAPADVGRLVRSIGKDAPEVGDPVGGPFVGFTKTAPSWLLMFIGGPDSARANGAPAICGPSGRPANYAFTALYGA
ncbi:unnamed protein product, partial [Iphiclides podalirius]